MLLHPQPHPQQVGLSGCNRTCIHPLPLGAMRLLAAAAHPWRLRLHPCGALAAATAARGLLLAARPNPAPGCACCCLPCLIYLQHCGHDLSRQQQHQEQQRQPEQRWRQSSQAAAAAAVTWTSTTTRLASNCRQCQCRPFPPLCMPAGCTPVDTGQELPHNRCSVKSHGPLLPVTCIQPHLFWQEGPFVGPEHQLLSRLPAHVFRPPGVPLDHVTSRGLLSLVQLPLRAKMCNSCCNHGLRLCAHG